MLWRRIHQGLLWEKCDIIVGSLGVVRSLRRARPSEGLAIGFTIGVVLSPLYLGEVRALMGNGAVNRDSKQHCHGCVAEGAHSAREPEPVAGAIQK